MDDSDQNAAKPLHALVRKVVRTQFAACDPVQMKGISGCCTRSLGWYLLVSWSSSRSHSEDLGRRSETRFWSFVFAALLDGPSHRLIPSYCRNNRAILAHVSIFPSLSHGSQDLSHAGASGLETKSDTFPVLSHTQLKGLSQ